MLNGRHLKTIRLPVLPQRSQRSGYAKALWGEGLRGVARVATTFINLNKKSRFRKNFFEFVWQVWQQSPLIYIGQRLNKTSCHLETPYSHCHQRSPRCEGSPQCHYPASLSNALPTRKEPVCLVKTLPPMAVELAVCTAHAKPNLSSEIPITLTTFTVTEHRKLN